MLNQSFLPLGELSLFCRHCHKVMPAQLERGIAETGRVVDKESTFEYFCSKCHHTICYNGKDLVETASPGKPKTEDYIPRPYSPREHFLVGEVIVHSSFNERGMIVGKDLGSPRRILVQFEKSGLKKFVESM